jgi:hypothetical protein
VRVGSRASALRRRFPRRRTVARARGVQVVAIRRRASVLVGVRRGRVRFLAVYDRRALHARKGLRLLAERALSG